MKLLGSTILAAALGGETRPRPDDLTGKEAKCQYDADRDSFTAGKFPDNFKARSPIEIMSLLFTEIKLPFSSLGIIY